MNNAAQSPDEVFDVVDAFDRVIGRATRAEVHSRGLFHRAVHLFWMRADGQLCLQRRSYAKDSCPGLLSSSCAGHLDAGEDYATAALRELNEELGIQANPGEIREVDAVPAHADLGYEFVRVYLLSGEHRACPLPAEVDSLIWRSPVELDAWLRREPLAFSSSIVHLLNRSRIRQALGLTPRVGG